MVRDGGGTSNLRNHVKKCDEGGEVSSYLPLDQETFKEKISEDVLSMPITIVASELALVDVYLTSIEVLFCLKMLKHYCVQMIGFVELQLCWILMMKILLRTFHPYIQK